MYGKSMYGIQKYAAVHSGTEEGREYFVNLSQYAPTLFAELIEMREVYNAQGHLVGILQHDMEDLQEQLFITTATWGLINWEKEFGIVTNFALSFEQRREILYAKIRGQGTTTRGMIIDTAKAFSGGDVDVIEDNQKYSFIVRFIGIKGIPRNLNAFIEMLEEIKPAHLAFKFEYRYTVWNELQHAIWNGLTDATWNGLRVLKEGNG